MNKIKNRIINGLKSLEGQIIYEGYVNDVLLAGSICEIDSKKFIKHLIKIPTININNCIKKLEEEAWNIEQTKNILWKHLQVEEIIWEEFITNWEDEVIKARDYYETNNQ